MAVAASGAADRAAHGAGDVHLLLFVVFVVFVAMELVLAAAAADVLAEVRNVESGEVHVGPFEEGGGELLVGARLLSEHVRPNSGGRGHHKRGRRG